MAAIQAIGAYFDGRDVVHWTRRPDGSREWRRTRGEHTCYVHARDLAKNDQARAWVERSNVIRSRRHDGDWIRIGFEDRDALYRVCSDRVHMGRGQQGAGLLVQMGIPTYEADLHPIRRWALESSVQFIKPRGCYLDIEADSRVGIANKEQARILSWTIGNLEGEYVQGCLEADTDDAERELLLDLFYELEGYDQVIGWYSDEYDYPVVEARAQRLRMTQDLRSWILVDQLPIFERMNVSGSKSGDEKQSMALDSVGRAVAKVGKVEGVNGSMTWKLWSEDAAFLAELQAKHPHFRGMTGRQILLMYNQRDVYTQVEIERKTGFIELHNTLAQSCGVIPDTHGANPLRYVDTFFLNLARERGEHLPSCFGRPARGQDTAKFEGAFVMEPKQLGIIHNVHVADFAAMYPSIIRTWNMSPETLTDHVLVEENRPTYLLHAPAEARPTPEGCCRTPNGTVYSNAVKGLLVIAVEKLIDLRKYWNKKKEAAVPGSPEYDEADKRATAYKVAANSFYGVVGCPFFRLFNRRVAESITLTGQWMIKQVLERGEDRGIRGVYADTDSNFATGPSEQEFGEYIDWLNRDFFPEQLRQMGTTRCELKLAYEKAFEVVVMVSKKRYAGRYAHYKGSRATERSKPEIKGLEYKRGDSPKLARALQSEVLDLLMGGGVTSELRRPTCDHSLESFERMVERWLERCFKQPLALEDIVKSQGLQLEIGSYSVRKKKDGEDMAQPAHVQIAKQLIERGVELTPGTKIEYFVVDGSKSPMKYAWAGDWQGDCDRYYLWDDVVYPPTQRVLEVVFPEVKWKAQLQRTRWNKSCRSVDRYVEKLQREYDESLKPRRGYNPNQIGLFTDGAAKVGS